MLQTFTSNSRGIASWYIYIERVYIVHTWIRGLEHVHSMYVDNLRTVWSDVFARSIMSFNQLEFHCFHAEHHLLVPSYTRMRKNNKVACNERESYCTYMCQENTRYTVPILLQLGFTFLVHVYILCCPLVYPELSTLHVDELNVYQRSLVRIGF